MELIHLHTHKTEKQKNKKAPAAASSQCVKNATQIFKKKKREEKKREEKRGNLWKHTRLFAQNVRSRNIVATFFCFFFCIVTKLCLMLRIET